MTDLIIPSRINKDNNWVSHWWTNEDFVGDELTQMDLFFGGGQIIGGVGGMNPVMDKHYKIVNVAAMVRYQAIAVANFWEIRLFDDADINRTGIVLNMANRTGGANKTCGSFGRSWVVAPCEKYHLELIGDVTQPVEDLQATIHLTLEVISDAK